MADFVQKIELNSAGMIKLFKDPAMVNACRAAGLATMKRAGYGYFVTAGTGRFRAGARVFIRTKKAAKDNLEHNTLIKALAEVLPDTEVKSD